MHLNQENKFKTLFFYAAIANYWFGDILVSFLATCDDSCSKPKHTNPGALIVFIRYSILPQTAVQNSFSNFCFLFLPVWTILFCNYHRYIIVSIPEIIRRNHLLFETVGSHGGLLTVCGCADDKVIDYWCDCSEWLFTCLKNSVSNIKLCWWNFS